MNEYTPTSEQVRLAFADDLGEIDPERLAEFDRWLAAHDQAVKAEALREAADILNGDGVIGWGDLWDGRRGVRVAENFPHDLRGMELIDWMRHRADELEGKG